MTSRKVENLDRAGLLAELERFDKLDGMDDRGRQVIARLIGEFDALPVSPLADDDASLNVYQRVAKVKEAIGALGKTEQMNQDGGYRYRGIEAILDNAHAALVRYGVVIAPIATEARYDTHTTRNNAVMNDCYLEVAWGVWGALGDRLDPMPVTRGEAFDSSDKATNKAHTAAFKVLLTELFAIPYGEADPDHERPEGAAQSRGPSEPWDPDLARSVMESWENLPSDLGAKLIAVLRERSHWNEGNVPTDWPPEWAEPIQGLLDKAWEKAESTPETPPVAPGAPETGPPDQTSGESGEGDTAPRLDLGSDEAHEDLGDGYGG